MPDKRDDRRTLPDVDGGGEGDTGRKNMCGVSCCAEDFSRRRARQTAAVMAFHHAVIKAVRTATAAGEAADGCREAADAALWETVIAFEGDRFFTSSGLPFHYAVKRKKSGDYSGELVVNRKEGSKTLTKSSVMLAFHRVLEKTEVADGCGEAVLVPAEFKGPKAIGQIFGVSYLYSLFWSFGLIRVPAKVESKLEGEERAVTRSPLPPQHTQ